MLWHMAVCNVVSDSAEHYIVVVDVNRWQQTLASFGVKLVVTWLRSLTVRFNLVLFPAPSNMQVLTPSSEKPNPD